MNIIENVMLVSDNGMYVAPRYSVLDSTVGSGAASTYLWLKCVSYGFSEHDDFLDYKNSCKSGVAIKSKLQGPCGTYVVVKLSEVTPYTRPNSFDAEFDFVSSWQLG